ncbi:MAG: minor capsid protein [Gammaproteobacteria bacterium]|nr:minor capsid protein [Gammaproteobacteria bacterium]
MPSANFALNLEPKKAKEWFAKKQISTKNYRDITSAEHAKVFTVANITNLDMLNDLKSSLDDAIASGKPFNAWKKELFNTLKRKGWLQKVAGKTEIFDPSTGEHFMGGHRLQRIYRTNMQSAYSAQQYQHYIANIDNRPYWRYDAVGDSRTRPSHSALNGLVYRYDDPFWSSHYPPNGYNCRCSVTPLAERDIKRGTIDVAKTADEDVVTVDKIINKHGDTVPVNGVRINGKTHTPNVGFDYNVGRMNYRPRLDNYDPDLAHAFCVREMSGRDFAYNYDRVERSLPVIKQRLGVTDDVKLSNQQLLHARNELAVFNSYAGGMLSTEIAEKIGSTTRTAWLSDDTLIKQFNSRLNQDFGLSDYSLIPSIINTPDYVFADKNSSFIMIKDERLLVIKVLSKLGEVFVQSIRPTSYKEVGKLEKKLQRIQ